LFWAQRAKADFLKYGDSNTRWFHARANRRCAANTIRSFEREDGSLAVEEEELQQVIVDNFAALFDT